MEVVLRHEACNERPEDKPMHDTKRLTTHPGHAAIVIAGLSIALFSPIAAPGQESNPRAVAKAFLGTWQATHGGKVYAIIKLDDAHGLAGSMSLGQIKSDDAGEITEVEEEARREPPLTAFKFENNRLSFDWKDSDDTTRFEMRVTGERTAEVRTVADPAPLRPFRLAKIAESPQN